MSALDVAIALTYLLAAVGFVLGLRWMRSPVTARRGNIVSASGMAAAMVATVALVLDANSGLRVTTWGWIALGSGLALGAVAGWVSARLVHMTAVPQLVSVFNAVGGGAAALVAIVDFVRVVGASQPSLIFSVPVVLDVLIGAVTLSGSIIAAGKLQAWISGSPIMFPGSRLLSGLSAALAVGASMWVLVNPSVLGLSLALVGALAFGVLMVLPIGGADMPVVVSLLNAFTGLAVAMAGFVLSNDMMIIAGALVGAAGTILTKLMADAMNRSVWSIMVGGFGTGDDAAAASGGAADVRRTDIDDVAIQLAYASSVVIVPGYGLAAAQAQREAGELGALLTERGITVSYAIHPVAGRMPGHMNVLLAEADAPYDQLKEMEQANAEFPSCDVALVVGANDVVNPAARRPGNPISGMPILDVDKAASIVIIKRSLGHGYAGMDNELFSHPQAAMLFADAKRALADILAAVKQTIA